MLGNLILLTLLKKEKLFSLVMAVMAYSLLFFADSFFSMWLSTKFGAYLTIALVAAATWLQALVILSGILRYQRLLNIRIKIADYPRMEFIQLSGLGISLLLCLSPGFLSDALCWLIYLPPFRLLLGQALFKKYQASYTATYELLSSEDHPKL